MNRIQRMCVLCLLAGGVLLLLVTLIVPLPVGAQQPRPTLTPTPLAVTPEPTTLSPEQPAPPSESTPIQPETLPSTGPSLLPVTGYGLTAIGAGIAMGVAALAAQRARRRRSKNPDISPKP